MLMYFRVLIECLEIEEEEEDKMMQNDTIHNSIIFICDYDTHSLTATSTVPDDGIAPHYDLLSQLLRFNASIESM